MEVVGGDAIAQLFEGTSRNFAGSFRDGVNPSGRTLALGSTQPLREMSTRNIF